MANFKTCTECNTTFYITHIHTSFKTCNDCNIKRATERQKHSVFDQESKTKYDSEFGDDSEAYTDEEQIDRYARQIMFWDRHRPVIDVSKMINSLKESKNSITKTYIYLN